MGSTLNEALLILNQMQVQNLTESGLKSSFTASIKDGFEKQIKTLRQSAEALTCI